MDSANRIARGSAAFDAFASAPVSTKNRYMTSDGKSIASGSLETDLMGARLIEHAIAAGKVRCSLAVLLTVNGKEAHPFVDAGDARHARGAGIRKFAVLKGDFRIAAGALTATTKLPRRGRGLPRRDRGVLRGLPSTAERGRRGPAPGALLLGACADLACAFGQMAYESFRRSNPLPM